MVIFLGPGENLFPRAEGALDWIMVFGRIESLFTGVLPPE
jgi:hypothetical protein